MRRGRLIGLTAAVSLILLAYGVHLWWQSRKQIATDDAYVEGSVSSDLRSRATWPSC